MASSRTISNACDKPECGHVAVVEVYRGNGSYYGKFCEGHGESTKRALDTMERFDQAMIRRANQGRIGGYKFHVLG